MAFDGTALSDTVSRFHSPRVVTENGSLSLHKRRAARKRYAVFCVEMHSGCWAVFASRGERPLLLFWCEIEAFPTYSFQSISLFLWDFLLLRCFSLPQVFLKGGGETLKRGIRKRQFYCSPSLLTAAHSTLWCFCWASRTPAEHCGRNPPQQRLVGKLCVHSSGLTKSIGWCTNRVHRNPE